MRVMPAESLPVACTDLTCAAGGEAEWPLTYRPPLAVPALLDFLAARAIPGVEVVDPAARSISRTVRLLHAGVPMSGRLAVRFEANCPVVWLSACTSIQPAASTLVPLVRRWLDLDAEPVSVDRALGALAGATPGLRLPGCIDRFELMVRAVLGQQITVAAARTLAGRLVQRFGQALPAHGAGPQWLFPSAPALACASPASIGELGIIRRRAEALIALAERWPEVEADCNRLAPQEALQRLTDLPGIGPWTAHYMLMRGWRWPDAFPPGDVVLRRVLSGEGPLLSPKAYLAAAEAWRPYRSYAVLHLWRQS